MAHVHTNKEGRAKDMQDERNKIESLFEVCEEVEDLPREESKMPRFDSWCEMSKAERNLYRDISE